MNDYKSFTESALSMHGIMKKYFILFYLFRVLFENVSGSEDRYLEINAEDFTDRHEGAMINGTFYKTVKRFYCSAASTTFQELLVYGSKAWTFPLQDVNLTLQYPPTNLMKNQSAEYILTEVNVMLYTEGGSSKGFITRGGMLQSTISMMFLMENITRLSYQFWLYGTSTAALQTATEGYNTIYHLC